MQGLRRFFGKLVRGEAAPVAPPVQGSALAHLFPGYVAPPAPDERQTNARKAAETPLTEAPAVYDRRGEEQAAAAAALRGEAAVVDEPAAPAAPAAQEAPHAPELQAESAEPVASAAPVVAPMPPEPVPELPDLAAVSVPVRQPGFWAGQILRLPTAGIATLSQPRPLLAGTEGFTMDWLAGWHRHQGWPSFDLACSFASDAVVSGLGHVWLDGKLVVDREVMPNYVYDNVLGLPAQPQNVLRYDALPLRSIARPCVVIAGGMNVYGHFLIEVLFSVTMVRESMAGTGLRYAYLMPAGAASWMVGILCDELGVPREDIEFYDPETERVHLRQAILPAMLSRGEGFHPAGNAMVDAFLAALGPLPPPPAAAPRLFLARNSLPGQNNTRECLNEPALVAIAHQHGFTAVAMEAMSWREQLALLRQAEILMGAFGSGLHAAMLCPSTTKVACLGLGNMVQSQIAALRGQEMAYLTEGFTIGESYSVDEELFTRFVAAVVA